MPSDRLWRHFGEPGHDMQYVSLVWNRHSQDYIAVVVHGGLCPGCLMEEADGPR